MLSEEKIDAAVINAGIDGDRPVFMLSRLEAGLKNHPNIKIVIFEPGPNERNPRFNLESTEQILEYLNKIKMPTIYVSHRIIQSDEDAEKLAKKYNAYYYGDWRKDVPLDRIHRQYDMGSSGGHMTVEGCQLWAKNMFPILKKVINENKLNNFLK